MGEKKFLSIDDIQKKSSGTDLNAVKVLLILATICGLFFGVPFAIMGLMLEGIHSLKAFAVGLPLLATAFFSAGLLKTYGKKVTLKEYFKTSFEGAHDSIKSFAKGTFTTVKGVTMVVLVIGGIALAIGLAGAAFSAIAALPVGVLLTIVIFLLLFR